MKTIDRKCLRSSVEQEQVDELWERIDQELVFQASPPPRWSRWSIAAAAAACGFMVGGLSFHSGSATHNEKPQAIALRPSHGPTLYAAGAQGKRVRLESGMVLNLSPNTVVEYRSEHRALLLLRGEVDVLPAPVSANNARPYADPWRLLVGDVHLQSRGARLRLRRLTTEAELRVHEGQVEVYRSPADSSTRLAKRLVLVERVGAGRSLRIALHQAAPSVMAAAASPDMPPAGDLSVAGARSPAGPQRQGPVVPAWVSACDRGDYQQAYEMVQALPGGAQAVIPTLKSAKQLLCISSGSQLKKDHEVAKIAAQRVVKEHEGDINAMVAASDLERIHAAQGNHSEAAKYRLIKERLSKDTLLTADALCNKIKQKAKNGEHSAVITYAQRYRQQYPGGACTQHIQQLVAQARRTQVDEDPYMDSDESSGDSQPKASASAKAKRGERGRAAVDSPTRDRPAAPTASSQPTPPLPLPDSAAKTTNRSASKVP